MTLVCSMFRPQQACTALRRAANPSSCSISQSQSTERGKFCTWAAATCDLCAPSLTKMEETKRYNKKAGAGMGVRQHRQCSGRQGLARAASGPQMSQRPSQPSQLPTGWDSQVAVMPSVATSCSRIEARWCSPYMHSCSQPVKVMVTTGIAGCTGRHLHASVLLCVVVQQGCRDMPSQPATRP